MPFVTNPNSIRQRSIAAGINPQTVINRKRMKGITTEEAIAIGPRSRAEAGRALGIMNRGPNYCSEEARVRKARYHARKANNMLATVDRLHRRIEMLEAALSEFGVVV